MHSYAGWSKAVLCNLRAAGMKTRDRVSGLQTLWIVSLCSDAFLVFLFFSHVIFVLDCALCLMVSSLCRPQSWADAFRSSPSLAGVVYVYDDLRRRGLEFPMTDLDALSPIHTPNRVRPPSRWIEPHQIKHVTDCISDCNPLPPPPRVSQRTAPWRHLLSLLVLPHISHNLRLLRQRPLRVLHLRSSPVTDQWRCQQSR